MSARSLQPFTWVPSASTRPMLTRLHVLIDRSAMLLGEIEGEIARAKRAHFGVKGEGGGRDPFSGVPLLSHNRSSGWRP